MSVGYFSQFGRVVNLKVSRNKKTAKAKHYGFIQFQSPEVAAIAAEAMNGYMLFTQKLMCHVLPKSKVHPEMFKGATRPFKKIPWQKLEAARQNKERTQEQQAHFLSRIPPPPHFDLYLWRSVDGLMNTHHS